MLDNILTIFGRPKNKSNKNQPQDSDALTGPFSTSSQQETRQPQQQQQDIQTQQPFSFPSVPQSIPEHYQTPQNMPPTAYYQPPRLPVSMPHIINNQISNDLPSSYQTISNKQVSPLDSVPFEAKVSSNSKRLVSLDELLREFKQAALIVDNADSYLKSAQSDYSFKVEQEITFN